MSTTPADPDHPVITTKQDLLDALVTAFVDGDPDQRQAVADELGGRLRPQPRTLRGRQ